ncbi:MAG: hypothetical protein KDA81_19990 [Planctomycetaceae bacterium]|nr:hypothetical protein [Planctomycetaceae bacterium]
MTFISEELRDSARNTDHALNNPTLPEDLSGLPTFRPEEFMTNITPDHFAPTRLPRHVGRFRTAFTPQSLLETVQEKLCQ